MQRINIFGHPSEYVIATDGATQVGMIEPATTYAFIVQNGLNHHSVHWVDNRIVDPYPQEAIDLLHLSKLIMEIILKQPAIQQLPPRGGGCL